jgi:hypothetical protein
LAVEQMLREPLVDPTDNEELPIPMLGIVDLLLDTPTGPVVVVFKTAGRRSPPLEIAHEIQLACYAYLVRRYWGVIESHLEIRQLVNTKVPCVETQRYAPRSVRHFERLFTVIREYVDALQTNRFNYRPGWMCGNCQFHDRFCPAM